MCASIHTTFNGKVAQRQHHFDLLDDLLRRIMQPSDILVIAGDLNCDVAHPEFHKITANKCVSALHRVALPGPTFEDKHGQQQTIDHVFHSPRLRAVQVDVEAATRGKPYGSLDPETGVASVVSGSDHSWVVVKFGFDREFANAARPNGPNPKRKADGTLVHARPLSIFSQI